MRIVFAAAIAFALSGCSESQPDRGGTPNAVTPPPNQRSPKLSHSELLRAASLALLGTAGEKRETIGGDAYVTEADQIIATPFGPVLQTSSHRPDAPYDSEASAGGIGIAYLSQDGPKITVKQRWPLIVAGGINGNSPYGVEREDRLTRNPALAVQDMYPLQGYHCEWITLIELRPEGPVTSSTIYLHADNKGTGEPAYEHDGRITNIDRGKSFDVVVPGTEIRDHYEMIKGRFVGPEQSELKC